MNSSRVEDKAAYCIGGRPFLMTIPKTRLHTQAFAITMRKQIHIASARSTPLINNLPKAIESGFFGGGAEKTATITPNIANSKSEKLIGVAALALTTRA